MKEKKKVAYTKPLVIATSKKGNTFSAGCPVKTASTPVSCKLCRCS